VKVRLLPSSPLADKQVQTLTSYLIDDALAIDAGSIGLALESDAMERIRDVVITHTHIDHLASLPLLIAEVFDSLDRPITVHATPEVVQVLRKHIFNNLVWPDFEKIDLLGGGGPVLVYHETYADEPFRIGDYKLTLVPVNHTIPTVGVFVERGTVAVAFTSDTYVTDRFWQVANQAPGLQAVFVDVSYPNEMESLAEMARHLTPNSLEADLRKLGREIDIYAVHIKPSSRETVWRQLQQVRPRVRFAEIGHTYEWLD
jgi:ribonuclease BN (tRNA processing enzyme)